MFWSRNYVKAKEGKFGNNGSPVIGRIVVEAANAAEAYEKIGEIEKTWGDEYYCVDSVMGEFATEEEARKK